MTTEEALSRLLEGAHMQPAGGVWIAMLTVIDTETADYLATFGAEDEDREPERFE